jgi:hypothetical protein
MRKEIRLHREHILYTAKLYRDTLLPFTIHHSPSPSMDHPDAPAVQVTPKSDGVFAQSTLPVPEAGLTV